MYNQGIVNKVWSDVWKSSNANYQDVFNQRLFIEGYPVFKKYIPKQAETILEIGAGSGRYGLKLAQDFSDKKVVITDIVDESLNFIKSFANYLKIKNIEISKEDIFNLSFPDNNFDVVFCDAVIQHLSHPNKAIREMKRVVKPGGIVIISSVNFWNIPHLIYKFLLYIIRKPYSYGYEKCYSKKELRKLMNDNKLKVITEDGFYFAYGIFRLKYISNIFKLVGRICNRIIKIIDSFSNRFISKKFGFEIFIVSKKDERNMINKKY